MGVITPIGESNSSVQQYTVAVLTAVAAVLVRALLDPWVIGAHALVLPLLAVIFVAWRHGFAPALVTLLLSVTPITYFFIEPRYSFVIPNSNDRIAVGLFLVTGVCCALLGESQRRSRLRVERHAASLFSSQAALTDQVQLAGLRADMGIRLARNEPLEKVLQHCSELLVQRLDAAFARIWTLDEEDGVLKLQASAGLYTHLDGPHSRIKVGEYKIGRIAQTRQPHLTNDVSRDPYIRNPEWAAREGMVAFAGFPLLVADRVVGVMAMFSRKPLTGVVLADLGPISDSVAQCVVRKRTEIALREGEERYRFLTDTLPALVWSCRADGVPNYHNSRWFEYTGISRDSNENLAAESVHPDDRQRTVERWNRALETGTRYQNEFRLRRADGAYHWFLAQALPMRGPEGAVIQWFGTAVDMDDQKQLQIELTQSLERFRLLTEAIPQIVLTANTDGQVTYFNSRWLDFTGLTVEHARGGGWTTAVHADDAERVTAAWQSTVANPSDRFIQEFRLHHVSDDTYRWFLAIAVPLHNQDGQVTQLIGSMVDIHDQKEHAQTLERLVGERTSELLQEVEDRRKAEELVRATATELARSNEELGKFAYVASHDLQEPLRKIQAFGDRLRAKYRDALDVQGQDYLDRVLKSAGRMRRLIEDLLALSRVTTKGQPFTSVDLSAVADGVLSDLEERIEETQGTVEASPLPTIDADPTQMRQLLQNLLGNALKFRKPDVAPVVKIRADLIPATDGSGSRPLCRLSVSDNGIGFDEKYLDRIFQVFQRLHSRGEYEGTGVGLAICRKIVERHGGSINAHSSPGVGATFVVTLPTRHPDSSL